MRRSRSSPSATRRATRSRRFTAAASRCRPKAFAMGVRIEHPQDAIDRIQYGRLSASCGVVPADYKKTHPASNGRGVYTFCMCPGGEVIACSSEAGGVVTNGMSRYKRESGFANSGLVVQTRASDFDGRAGPRRPPRPGLPAAGGARGLRPRRRDVRRAGDPGDGLPDSRTRRPSRATSRRRRTALPPSRGRLDSLYPPPYLDALAEGILAFDRTMKGFVSDEAVLIAPESRTSSPVRIERDDFVRVRLSPGSSPRARGPASREGSSRPPSTAFASPAPSARASPARPPSPRAPRRSRRRSTDDGRSKDPRRHRRTHRPRQERAREGADRNRSRPAPGGEGARHHDRPRLRPRGVGRDRLLLRRRPRPREVRPDDGGRGAGGRRRPLRRRLGRLGHAPDARASRDSLLARREERGDRADEERPRRRRDRRRRRGGDPRTS